MTEFVDASPAKRFFVEMLIRDIRLEDAVLDLIDNAIDSLIRHESIDLENLVKNFGNETLQVELSKFVTIDIKDDCFTIRDNCGGIDIKHAREQVFRFGAHDKPTDSHLSVYGIGLKRAVLKIGRLIEVRSKTLQSGFKVIMNIDDFESSPDVWRFPIETIDMAADETECGTEITIKKLTQETKNRIRSGTFESNLTKAIGESYSLFLKKFVIVRFNNTGIPPVTMPIANSAEVSTSLTKENIGNVEVTLVAGLQSLDGDDWRGGTAGWYIICNGRIVVFADRTSLTGWGVSLPIFQPKHRGFIGIALFMSTDPEALPWTTTKRGVNAESEVFQAIKERMIADSRPVISFLDKRYASVPVSSENTDDLEVKDKTLQEALLPAPVNKLFGDTPRRFSTVKRISQKTKTTSVQFRTDTKDIERARRAIGNLRLAAGKVGLHALNYFLDNEADQ